MGMSLLVEYHGVICFVIGLLCGGALGVVGTAVLVSDQR